jgi:hypothetical protein
MGLGQFLKDVNVIFIINIQLELMSENPLEISGKDGTSGKHRAKRADLAEISGFSAFTSN